VDFTEDPDHRAIRAAVREVCARFPDEYWAERDESHTFPWDFYAAMAKGGWIGVAIPAEYGGAAAASPRPRWSSATSPSTSSACPGRTRRRP
jgi:alkylation response protein AidB-like acyl-CoA dehydrogenase